MPLFTLPVIRAMDANGHPLPGALLYFYRTGTLDPEDVYTTNDLDVAHENPVEANSGGLFPSIYLDSAVTYRAILKTSAGTVVQDIDPYNGASGATGILTPEQFGALGEGDDDTAGLLELAAAVNEAGTGHVRFTPGKTYLLGHDAQSTLYFHNVDGLYIEGYGATLKTKDNGAPTSSLGYNWGQINVDNCTNVHILGLTFDGNRDGQTHTSGHPDGYGYNAGLNIWNATEPHTSEYIYVRECRFLNHGVLSSTIDARGDGIFAVSGVSHFFVENCVFENCGRWALAIAEGVAASTHFYFRNNLVDLGERAADGHIPWGAIDIEDGGLNHSHFYINGNTFNGTSPIAIGGYAGSVVEATVSDVYIRDNVWNLPSAIGATDVPFNIGNGNIPEGVYRTLERLFIEDNIVTWDGIPSAVGIGTSAKLYDVFIRRNIFKANGVATADNGLLLAYGGHMEGRVEVTDNRFVGLGEAIKNGNSWYNDPSPAALQLRIENNVFENCGRSFNLSFNDLVVPTGSSLIIFRGNKSRDTRNGSGEYIDGGGITTHYYDAVDADNIWTHTALTYKGNSRTLGPCTVAQLPAASAALQGARGSVTDANATTRLSTVAGGGSNKVGVRCDGTNWVIE